MPTPTTYTVMYGGNPIPILQPDLQLPLPQSARRIPRSLTQDEMSAWYYAVPEDIRDAQFRQFWTVSDPYGTPRWIEREPWFGPVRAPFENTTPLYEGDVMPSPRASDFEGRLVDTRTMSPRSQRAAARAINPWAGHGWCTVPECETCQRAAADVIRGHNDRTAAQMPPNHGPDATPAQRAICAAIDGAPTWPERRRLSCQNCGTAVWSDAITWVDGARNQSRFGQHWCRGCVAQNAFYSDMEGRYVWNRYRGVLWSDARTRLICSRYYAEAQGDRCGGCGEYFVDINAHSETGCTPPDDGRPTYGYHGTTPTAAHGWPKVTPRDALCFGVELEMESKYGNHPEYQKQLSALLGGKNGWIKDKAILGRYVLERDGSLDDSGIEMVTNPYTLDFHQHSFGWAELLGKVRGKAKSGKGTTHCGMHVHANRRAISAFNLGKVMVFINAPKNTALIQQVAQRDSGYAKRIAKKIEHGGLAATDKYEAVHLGETTVEFRIFRGNLRPERVLKNLEFCHSVISYCKDASIKAVETPTDYENWLRKNRGSYPNLFEFLSLKIYMNDEAKEE